MMIAPVGGQKATKTTQQLCLCLCLVLVAATYHVNCQQSESELDDQFQDFHSDLGRISGGASRTAQAPVARSQPQQQPQHQQPQVHHAQPVTTRHQQQQQPAVVAQRAHHTSTHTRPTASSSGSQHQRSQQQAPKRNRITLAVRQHTPAPPPSIGQLEPVAATIPFQSEPITQPIAQPALHSQPQVILTRPGAGDELSSGQYASLMARVAAERQAQDQAIAVENSQAARGGVDEFVPAAAPPSTTGHALGHVSAASSQGSFQSPSSLAQVVAPPAAQAPSFSVASEPVVASSTAFGDSQPEEQIEAPTFQHVLSNGCPRKGVFSWENKDNCDRYYMCTNGTFTEEACPNGLAYSQMGAVYQHCAYQWNVDCGVKKSPGPLASPGCPWQFGIFPTSAAAQCSIDYFVCEWGVPEKKRCQPEGLFYDDRIKGCQWADQLGCKSEALLNFKCPPEDEDNAFWPFPRYYHTKQDVIVCVNEQPRLVHCTEEQVVEPSSLSCIDLKKKKKKF